MKISIVILVVFYLSACSTQYQPQGLTGGFSDTQLDRNIFIVTFKGNGFTSREKANDFALLRSAEITLEHGFKYFVIIDNQDYSKSTIPV